MATPNENKLPYQRLTTAEKIKQYGSVQKWGEAVIHSLDSVSTNFLSYLQGYDSKYQMAVNADLADGRLNVKDFEHLISEFRLNQKETPNNLKNYPLIPQILRLLQGDKMGRPFNYKVIQTNQAANDISEHVKKEKLFEVIANKIKAELEAAGLVQEDPETGEPQFQNFEDVDRYMQFEWNDIREKLAYDSLTYLEHKERLKYKFNKNFKNFLTTGQAIFKVDVTNNEPTLRQVNPLNFDFDLSPDSESIEDSSWVREVEYLNVSEVYDRYYSKLTPEQVHQLELEKGSMNDNNRVFNASVPIYYHNNNTNSTNIKYSNSIIKVVHMQWVGLKKVGILQTVDLNTGAPITTMVEEDYKKQDHDIKLDWHWINEVWEGTRIGTVYLDIQPRANQHRSIDNPSRVKLSYVGVRYEYCVVDLLKSYQYLYNVMMYRFEHAIALAKGKALLFDVAQIPSTMNLEQFMYYLNTANIAFLNSAQEGPNGVRASFNQFQAIDMTLSNSIQYYINVLDKIEVAAGMLVGVSPQRMSAIKSTELVGNVEKSIMQSSIITEHLFETYDDFQRRTLEILLEEAKLCWKEGKKSTYILDNGTREFLNIEPELFSNSDFGVFLSNNSKDQEVMNTVKQFAQNAVQAGQAQLSDIVKLFKTDNITEGIRILEAAEQAANQRAQEQSKQQSEDIKAQIASNENIAKLERELKDALNLRDNNTKLEIEGKKVEQSANKAQEAFGAGFDRDRDGLPDELELAKLDLELSKFKQESAVKARELELKDKELDIKAKQAAKKPSK